MFFIRLQVLQYYSPQIFASVGFSTEKTLLFQSINSVIALIGEACCVLLVDKLGRRGPLIWANIASGSTFVIGTALQAKFPASANNDAASYAFIVMTWLFNFAFSSAIGPLSWAYPVEIMNTSIRAKGTAITSMGAWISNFLIAQVSPKAFAAVGWRYYLLFAICGFTNALTMWLLFPETKGRTLEEMDDYFEQTHWIVPLDKSHGQAQVSQKDREEELRRGVIHVGPSAADMETVQDEEKGGSFQLDTKDSV